MRVLSLRRYRLHSKIRLPLKKKISANISLGQAIPFSVYDEKAILLLRQGAVITMPSLMERLVARGPLFNASGTEVRFTQEAPSLAPSPAAAPSVKLPPFEHINELTLNLKHVIGTALRSPEQINLAARIGKIGLAIQDICAEDVDSAIAAPCFDTYNSYIVVHQMMGAVLAELIAQGKGLSKIERLSLICAALTRDLGQMPIQSELDNHAGPFPDALRARMQRHPEVSVEFLKRAGVNDTLWLEAVRGHHERLNGSGYPAGLRGDQVPQGARILAVADSYSAMIKSRPYRHKPHFPQHALKEIYQRKDAEIDGEIVRILISKIGLLSPGTIVKLKCGEIAVVKSPTVSPGGAVVYSVYSVSGMPMSEPVRRETSEPKYEIIGLVPFSECRTASVIIKRIWNK